MLELVGSEAASVDLDIRLDSSLGVPPMLGMKLLKTMLAGHDPHPLVTGTDYFGKFVLESFGERWKHLTGIGVCIVDEVSLKLTEYSKGWA